MRNEKVLAISLTVACITASAAFLTYLLILLIRTDYGSHETSVGTDVLWMAYMSSSVGLAGLAFCVFKHWLQRGLGLHFVALTALGLFFFLVLHFSGMVVDRSAHIGSGLAPVSALHVLDDARGST